MLGYRSCRERRKCVAGWRPLSRIHALGGTRASSLACSGFREQAPLPGRLPALRDPLSADYLLCRRRGREICVIRVFERGEIRPSRPRCFSDP